MKSFAMLTMKSEQARMKSATAPQMKLNPPTRRQGGFHPRQGISSSKMISPTRQGWI